MLLLKIFTNRLASIKLPSINKEITFNCLRFFIFSRMVSPDLIYS